MITMINKITYYILTVELTYAGPIASNDNITDIEMNQNMCIAKVTGSSKIMG